MAVVTGFEQVKGSKIHEIASDTLSHSFSEASQVKLRTVRKMVILFS